ncbi:cytochrome c biogenesis CcdA family protein [Humibacter ginsenosidimutans]|uniref:Uncharacterized protein n=1 Tax=Humibacter ginsenosidimutans TaxID=2599293 RepID=A0A5B8M5U6_9MICO|nr:cytochrome c biogenesis protein CcdA [Humibacter ginsenosidimutans]QDZ15469.1 hypothetical protein FPZ11_12515 [Humibacter ginsenosidimutans]
MIDGAVIAFAFTVGLTGLINPCGLPLLPVYLTAFLDDAPTPWSSRLLASLRAGGCLTLGFVTVFGVAGAVEASLAAAITAVAPWVMLLVGTAIVALGAMSIVGRAPTLHLPGLSFRSGRGALAMIGFGVAYAIGSLSCSLPIFVAAVGSTLAAGSPLRNVIVFVAYALGMGLFATAVSVIASFGGAAVPRSIRSAARVLPRIAGGVCVLVGLYLMAYWANVLGAPDGIASIVSAVDGVQSAVVTWLDSWWLPVAVGCAVVVISALIALATAAERRPAVRSVQPAQSKEGPR